MSRKLSENYPTYDTVYGTEIPTEQYYVILFDRLPSKYSTTSNYDETINKFFISIGFVEECNVFSSNKVYDLSSQSLYVNIDLKMMVRISGNVNKKKNSYVKLDIIYDIKQGLLSNQLDLIKIKGFEKTKKKANIQLVKSDMGHLDTEEYDLMVPQFNLKLNYGDSFSKVNDVIVKKLNEDNGKGIILLHGDPGTGKTSYIKYLTTLIKEKDILFIPPSMAEMLSEPSIIPFLMDHKNSILIIEDAERVISDREGNGSPAGVSNILNLTDGILGDCLSIQIVATFNMKREKIDQALLRKGRLIAEHKFEKLTIDETNRLLKHINKDYKVSEGLTLADIYNIDLEVHRPTNKKSKLGF